MKLKSILQVIKCPDCRSALPVLEHKRVLNFTEGDTTLCCKNCHVKLGIIPFSEWNKLQRENFEKPELAIREAKRAEPNRNRDHDRRRQRRR